MNFIFLSFTDFIIRIHKEESFSIDLKVAKPSRKRWHSLQYTNRYQTKVQYVPRIGVVYCIAAF